MASIQSLSGLGLHGPTNKISKARAKTAVKPILKKLTSQSEKNSLDLDRGWLEQDGQYRRDDGIVGGGIGGRGGGGEGVVFEPSGKDTNLTFNEAAGTRRYNHSRSISGTSHISVATSGSSGARHQAGAPFVHPFQQMPRTTTPPVSYANSQTSFFDITEDDDSNDYGNNGNVSHRNSLHIHPSNPHSHSQPTLSTRRPVLANTQRTTSYSEVNHAKKSSKPSPNSSHPPSLRINTSRAPSTTPGQSSRLANVSSRSDLQLDCMVESPSSSTNAGSNHITSPASSVAPMSPLRSSFDSGFPRLRAKSDLDTATRAEHLREARRKFELREKAKEEKYAREEIKRRERADNKRALELEKHAAVLHKEQMAAKARQEAAEIEAAIARGKHNRKFSATSSGRPSLAVSRTSMSRPGTSRKNAPSPLGEAEKFASRYDSLDANSTPAYGSEAGGAHDVVFQTPKRKNTAKKKTQSTWTMFILWLRTKLLRVSKGR
ncbi:hypothetical protein M426DRAFT_14679 [Hypoxylon sp. CI-4A]|nr:hypothetical protein M426DRAFT_14679 [Hypoxylon sp. CI-4A]